MKNNYIDNKLFFNAMADYIKSVRKAKRLKTNKPKIPEYIGSCFMLIAENMSHKYNFLNYTFRDEMIMDAVENCVMYCDNFDYIKYKNPFAYFTQICYYAFIRRIQKEKKQLYVKYKSTEQAGLTDEFEQLENKQYEQYDNISEFIQKFETARTLKKEK